MVKVLQDQIKKGDYKYLNSDGYYMDGYLKANLEKVKHSVLKQDYDSFIVITGREGFGKSTLAFQVAKFLDPTFDLNRVVFSIEQFEEVCMGVTKGNSIVFDETMGYLSSRGAMSMFNRRLIKIMSEMRSKNLFVILCIPNFFELDRYPAIHRTTGLLHIYKRGHFGSYDYNTKKKLYLQGKKAYSYSISPNYIGHFHSIFILDKVEYEAKKQKSISDWVKNNKEDNFKKQRDNLIGWVYEMGKTQEEIAKRIGLSQQVVSVVLPTT